MLFKVKIICYLMLEVKKKNETAGDEELVLLILE